MLSDFTRLRRCSSGSSVGAINSIVVSSYHLVFWYKGGNRITQLYFHDGKLQQPFVMSACQLFREEACCTFAFLFHLSNDVGFIEFNFFIHQRTNYRATKLRIMRRKAKASWYIMFVVIWCTASYVLKSHSKACLLVFKTERIVWGTSKIFACNRSNFMFGNAHFHWFIFPILNWQPPPPPWFTLYVTSKRA